MKKILLVCSCLAFTFIAKAQTEDKKWNIGLHSGVTQYQGDLGNNFYKTDKAFYGFGGVEQTDNGLKFNKGLLPEKWKSLKIIGVGTDNKTILIK